MCRKQPKTIKEHCGLSIRFGGPDEAGWLPPNASIPREENVVIDLRITESECGFFLVTESNHPHFRGGDSWYSSLQEAMEAAEQQFGVGSDKWIAIDE